MTDQTKRLGIVVYVEDQATGKLAKVKAEVAGLGGSGRIAGSGLAAGTTSIERSVGRIGGALSHAKGQLASLITGPLGFTGLAVGVAGIAAGLTGAVRSASEFGAAVTRVRTITNMTTAAASAMVDTLDKWGVTGERQIAMVGKLEKNLGAIVGTTTKGAASTEQIRKATEQLNVAQQRLNEVEAKGTASQSTLLAARYRVADAERKLVDLRKGIGASTSGAIAFEKKYGFSLLDSNGKLADANTLLLRSADYLTSNASATNKALVMSSLWGKSWQDLVPILSKGSAFIRAQEADAIHLTDTQVANIAKFNLAQREFSDTWGDIQVKVGAELMPFLTSGLQQIGSWLNTHGDELAAFFGQAATFAGQLGGAINDIVLPAFGAIAGAWNGLPPELRNLLIAGFIARGTVKFLFGVDILKPVVGGILDTLKGNLLSRGSSPANPMWTASVGGGSGGGVPGAPGAAAAGGFLAPGALALAVGVATPLIMFYAIPALVNSIYGAKGNELKAGQDLGLNPTANQTMVSLGLGNVMAQVAAANAAKAAFDHGTAELSAHGPTTTGRDRGWEVDNLATGHAMKHLLDALHVDFQKQFGLLVKATDPAKVAAAAKAVLRDIEKGVGSARTTGSVLDTLRSQRAAAAGRGDTQLVKILDADIEKVAHKLDARRLVERQIAQAQKIVDSTESSKDKLDDLRRIQADLRSRGDTHAAAKIGTLIDTLRNKKLQVTTKLTVDTSAYATASAGGGGIVKSHSEQHRSTANTHGQAAGGYSRPGQPRLTGELGPELDVPLDPRFVFPAGLTGALRSVLAGGDRSSRNGSGGGRPFVFSPVNQISLRLEVTPAPLKRAITIQERYGPSTGSAGAGHHGLEALG